jgi:hypothetical protein
MVGDDTVFRSRMREAADHGDLPLLPSGTARARGQRRRATRTAAGATLALAALSATAWAGLSLPAFDGSGRQLQPASTTTPPAPGLFRAAGPEGLVFDDLRFGESTDPGWKTSGKAGDPEAVRVVSPSTLYAPADPRPGGQGLSYLPRPCGARLDVRSPYLLTGLERSSTVAGSSGRVIIAMQSPREARRLVSAVRQAVDACPSGGPETGGRLWTAEPAADGSLAVSDRSEEELQLGGTDYLLASVDSLVWVGVESGELGPDAAAQLATLRKSFNRTTFPKD